MRSSSLLAAVAPLAWSVLACSGAAPPASPGPTVARPTEERGPVDAPTPPPARSLAALGGVAPRTLAQVHLVHLAQLQGALRDPANADLDEHAFRPIWDALGDAFAAAVPDDVALARELAEAAPELAEPLLEAMTGTGGPFGPRAPSPALAAGVDAIVLEGPASAKAWALVQQYGGSGGDPRAFVRAVLERAEATGRCPDIDEEVGAAVDRLFGSRQGVPCLQAADRSPDELSGRSVDELVALVETGGAVGDAAAVALRTRVQQADTGTPGALAAVLPAESFGRLVVAPAEIGLVLQLLTSAHGEPAWVDWLALHPERIPAAQREMVAMLLEGDTRPATAARNRAALARLRATPATLPPAGPRFAMPDDDPATLAATWRLAAGLTELGPLGGVYLELMRRSVIDPAAKATAARHEADIAAALGRCAALVQARPTTTWLERTLADATAASCSGVALLAANVWTPRLKRELVAAIETGPDAWAREVYSAVELGTHEAELPAATLDAVLRRPPPVRDALLVMVTSEALWARLPAEQRTDDAVLDLVARRHGATLLGTWPDRVERAEAATDVQDAERAQWFQVSSSELAGIAPTRILLGVMSHRGALRPLDVARIVR